MTGPTQYAKSSNPGELTEAPLQALARAEYKKEKESTLGHKVHPTGFRLGVVKGLQSRWYAERDYKDLFAEDFLLRKIINKELFDASVARIEIERAAANQVAVTIHTAKPGIVIGRSGQKVDKLRAQLE